MDVKDGGSLYMQYHWDPLGAPKSTGSNLLPSTNYLDINPLKLCLFD